jgi:hypothetical protein
MYVCWNAIDGDLISQLSSDPLILGDVLFAICKPQADQQNVDDESFAEGLAGDSIDEACKALVDALVSYFPESRRRLLRKAADKQKMIETRGLGGDREATGRSELVDKIVEGSRTQLAVPTSSDSSSDSPASSASIPDH